MTILFQWGVALPTAELIATCRALEQFCAEHGHDEAETIEALEPALHELQRRRDKALSRALLDIVSP